MIITWLGAFVTSWKLKRINSRGWNGSLMKAFSLFLLFLYGMSGARLVLRDPDRFPLAYGLERFISSYSDQTHLLLAAAVLFSAPLVVLFFLAQRTFVEGVVTTGSKG